MSLSVDDFRHAVSDTDRNAAIDLIERSLLGTIIVQPATFRRAQSLTRADFRAEARGEFFEALRDLDSSGRAWDMALLIRRLVEDGLPPPRDGWYVVVGQLMDLAAPDDDVMDQYVVSIKEARAVRVLKRLRGAA